MFFKGLKCLLFVVAVVVVGRSVGGFVLVERKERKRIGHLGNAPDMVGRDRK